MNTSLQRENDEMRLRIRALEQQTARAGRSLSGHESHELTEIQARFDQAGAALGERASSPTMGETPLAYRRRLAQDLAKHSLEFKDSRFDSVPAEAMDVIEPRLYAAAKEAAYRAVLPGALLAVQEPDGSGRMITKHYGDPAAWMSAFMTQGASGHFRIERE